LAGRIAGGAPRREYFGGLQPSAGTGDGPRLYRHPYPETFIIRSGEALFTVGDDVISAAGGQIVVVPLNTPHKFTKPVRLRWRRSTSMKAAHSSPNGWSKRFCGGMIVNRSIARK
jgi:hypothetical protein